MTHTWRFDKHRSRLGAFVGLSRNYLGVHWCQGSPEFFFPIGAKCGVSTEKIFRFSASKISMLVKRFLKSGLRWSPILGSSQWLQWVPFSPWRVEIGHQVSSARQWYLDGMAHRVLERHCLGLARPLRCPATLGAEKGQMDQMGIQAYAYGYYGIGDVFSPLIFWGSHLFYLFWEVRPPR